MYITYSKIIELNVFDLKSHTNLGEICDAVIDNEKLKIVAFVLKKQSIWDNKTLVIVETDILEISKLGIVVNNEDSVVNIDDLVRIKDKVSGGYVDVGQSVITESGKKLGQVFDLLFDSKSLEITKLYVKNIFGERIFSCKSVVSYENNIITIKDDKEQIRIASEEAETSVA